VLRFWGSRASQQGLHDDLEDLEDLDSADDLLSSGTDNDNNNTTPRINGDTTAIEGTSGSGSINRSFSSADTAEQTSSSRFIDELDNIASDLFNSVSRQHRPRVREYTNPHSSTSSNNNNNRHNWPAGNGRLYNHNAENLLGTPSHHNSSDDLHTSVDHNTVSFENQIEVLSRLLEVAATSTVSTLMGSSFANGRRFDNTSVRSVGNSEIEVTSPLSEDSDSTFQEFIQSLRNGLLSTELSGNLRERETRDDRTFFRAFRFDSEDNNNNNNNNNHHPITNGLNINLPTFANVTASSNSGTTDNTHNANENPMVPVMIVGVRSVQQGSENFDEFVNNNHDNEVDSTADALNETSLGTPNPGSLNTDSSLSSFSSSTDESTVPNAHSHEHASNLASQRSWIIFVMGNTFTWNHPLLSAPSLMSDNPTYEDLLNLQELIGQVKPQVVSTDELHKHDDQLFELKLIDEGFTPTSKHEIWRIPSVQERCQICLTDYENNEIIRKLSSCNHFYHKDCVDTWLLKGMNNCPLCRSKGIE
jgi:hypothetical protein